MRSPHSGHKNYNRFKYYSALRTGLKHLPNSPNAQLDSSILEPPSHVIDDDLYVFNLPFIKTEPGQKQKSIVIIFSCWNTMIGTAVVSLPWAFQ